VDIFTNRLCARLLAVLTLILALVACSDFAGTVPEVTYPSKFNYVNREEITSRMHVFRYEIQQLDLALAHESKALLDRQQQVVDILDNIGHIASSIQADVAGSNHPFLQNDMATFLATVGQARTAATLNPPRYYGAGVVSGGCINCHLTNRR